MLQGMVDRVVHEDSPAPMGSIKRAVLLMNDLLGIDAQASLESVSVPGTTRLVVNAAEGRLFQGGGSATTWVTSIPGPSATRLRPPSTIPWAEETS
jgi:hemolysin activation/secretion protein